VGIFHYQILEHEHEERVSDGCALYNHQFIDAPNGVLVAAQFCAVLAPTIASIAILILTCESICCQFYGSFLAANVLFLTAALVQVGTFSIFGEPTFCFSGCKIGSAVYFSAFSAFSFFVTCILLCGTQRSVTCCELSSRKGRQNYREEVSVAPNKVILPSVVISRHNDSFNSKY
jgi:hypothetical protein